MDPFEDKLSGKIREVFDNYSEEGAELGWQELRKTYPPERNKRPLIYWASTAAALLCLYVGVRLFRPEPSGKNTHLTERHIRKISPQPARNSSKMPPDGAKAQKNTIPDINHPPASVKKYPVVHISSITAFSQKTALPDKILQDSIGLIPSVPLTISNHNPGERTNLTPVIPDSSLTGKLVCFAGSTKRKILFSLNTSTFLTYAKGSSPNLNMGAGISVDFPLSRNVTLHTGTFFSKQGILYTTKPGNSNLLDFPLSYSSGSSSQVPVDPNSVGFESYQANFLGLEIPVALSYGFNASKRPLMITAGISSYLFFKETYTTTYSYSLLASNPNYIANSLTNDLAASRNYSGRFEPAGSLHASLGWGYSLWKKQTLFIEPFVKYPLRGMGKEDIKFGTGGLNIKVRF